MFKAVVKSRDHPERPRSLIGAFVFTCRFKCMIKESGLISFKLFVGPDLGPKLSAYVISRGSLIAMFKIKEAAMGSVARRCSNNQ